MAAAILRQNEPLKPEQKSFSNEFAVMAEPAAPVWTQPLPPAPTLKV